MSEILRSPILMSQLSKVLIGNNIMNLGSILEPLTKMFVPFLGLQLTSFMAFSTIQSDSEDSIHNNSPTQLIIDDITCRGNITTECAFVTKKYFQDIGEVLNPEEIADARLRLGTLVQFRAVDVYLEKGRERGHVVVVFDVSESNNLFYEVGLGIDGSRVRTSNNSDFENDQTNSGLNAKVTNFNFLGTGKELSLAVSGVQFESDTNLIGLIGFQDNSGNLVFSSRKFYQNYQRNSYDIGLNYFDPHLFGSSHYYLVANTQIRKNHLEKRSSEVSIDLDPPEMESIQYKRHSSSTSHSLLLGRRFGSHSYAAIDVSKTNAVTADQTTIGITYGWNSENDTLLPSKGEDFSLRLSRFRDEYEANLNYRKNLSFNENKVFSFGSNITFNLPNDYCTACSLVLLDSISASVFARFTNIKPINKSKGQYRSWFAGFHTGQGNISEDSYNYHFSGINAGYTYQTDSVIYRFSLAFNVQENK